MKGGLLFLVCWLVVACSGAIPTQTVIFTALNKQGVQRDTYTVGVQSNYYLAELSDFPDTSFSLTFVVSDPSITFTPSVLQFDPTTRAAGFRYVATTVNSFFITPTLSTGGQNQFRVSTFNITTVKRAIKYDILNMLTVNVKYPTEPIQLQLDTPSTGDLVFTPTSDYGVVSFIPSTVTIPAGSLAASFRFQVNTILEDSNATTVSWTVAGSEASLYSQVPLFSLETKSRLINLPALSQNTIVGFNSTTLYAYTEDYANSTVTITPTAPETVFSPSMLTFTPGVRIVPFTFVTQTPEALKTIYYTLDGDEKADYSTSVDSALFSVQKRTVNVQVPQYYVFNVQTTLSIRVGAPLTQPVTVYLFAGNLKFTPSNVTLSGNNLAQTVSVLPTAVGPDEISFLVTGVDSYLYNTPSSIELSVVKGFFINPADWYIPTLFVGIESPRIPVRLSIPPQTNVSLTISSPDAIFAPAILHFTKNTLQQYFTITPYFSNAGIDSVTVSTLKFIVGGADLFNYESLSDASITVNRRTTQIQWSAQLYNTQVYANQVKTLYLKKQYIVWASINHPSKNGVSITPVSPYLSFQPAVLKFAADQTDLSFTVTVEAAVGQFMVDYIIGGADAGLYATPVMNDAVITLLRPLSIYQAVLSPDARTAWGYLYSQPTSAALKTNHVSSFSLATGATPDSLTITPRSRHIKFNPASITISSANYKDNNAFKQTIYTDPAYIYFPINAQFLAPNFSVAAYSAGIHEVWIELSGPDADYYEIPANFQLKFNEYALASTDVSKIISSASGLASSVVGCMTMFVIVFFAC